VTTEALAVDPVAFVSSSMRVTTWPPNRNVAHLAETVGWAIDLGPLATVAALRQLAGDPAHLPGSSALPCTPEEPVHHKTRTVLAVVLAGAAAWFAWLGWDISYQTDPATGTTSGPYEAWQVIGAVVTLALVAVLASLRLSMFGAAAALAAGFAAAWTATSAPEDQSGLWVVGGRPGIPQHAGRGGVGGRDRPGREAARLATRGLSATSHSARDTPGSRKVQRRVCEVCAAGRHASTRVWPNPR
jgi:hypothetical protein